MTLRYREYFVEDSDFYVFGTVVANPAEVVRMFIANGIKAWTITKGDSDFRAGKKTVKVLGDPDKINMLATEMSVYHGLSFREYKRRPRQIDATKSQA